MTNTHLKRLPRAQANKHGYRGIAWVKQRQRFEARIGGKRVGFFKTAEEAARAYDLAAIERYGDRALLNFGSKNIFGRVAGSPVSPEELTESKKIPLCGQRICHNSTGFKGVDYDRTKRRWRATIGSRTSPMGVLRSRWTNTGEEAALLYDEMARDRYGSDAHVNFPFNDGENAVLKAPSDACGLGHPYPQFLYIAPDGRRCCRGCNAERVIAYNRRKDIAASSQEFQ